VGEFGPGTGLFGFKRRAWTAYMKAYPSCYSKAAARSSASRLLKRPRVKSGSFLWTVEIRSEKKSFGHDFYVFTAFPYTSKKRLCTRKHVATRL
jgi:hypothetical protein